MVYRERYHSVRNYSVLRLRKRIGAAIHPLMEGIDEDDIDEIQLYERLLSGYPIFMLGALIFAMIWAYIAWSRFWGWDPKRYGRLLLGCIIPLTCISVCRVDGMARNRLGLL